MFMILVSFGFDNSFVCCDGNLFIVMVEVVECNGYGYVIYDWLKFWLVGGVIEELYFKFFYVKLFLIWVWVIGLGIYIDDFDVVFVSDFCYYLLCDLVWVLMFVLFVWLIGCGVICLLIWLYDIVDCLKCFLDIFIFLVL